jgi:hypothetical protein
VYSDVSQIFNGSHKRIVAGQGHTEMYHPSFFPWLSNSRNGMTIPIQRSHNRNMFRLGCGFRQKILCHTLSSSDDKSRHLRASQEERHHKMTHCGDHNTRHTLTRPTQLVNTSVVNCGQFQPHTPLLGTLPATFLR